jgi:hemerythrin
MVEWNKMYATGVEDVDEQHKILFRFLNEIDAELQGNADERFLRKTLEFLEAYIRLHFSFEEMCMDVFKSSVAEDNKKAHKEFIRGVDTFKEKFKSEGKHALIIKDIHYFILDWFANHILTIDTKIKKGSKSK